MCSPDLRMKSLKVVCLFLAIGLAAVAFGAPKLIRRMSHPFQEGVLQTLQKDFDGDNPALVEDGEPPYRTGKVLLIVPEMWKEVRMGGATISAAEVNAQSRGRIGEQLSPPEVDSEQFDLDDDVRADTVDDVATMIFCEKRRVTARGLIVLDADTGKVVTTVPPADARAIRLTIVDRKSKSIITRCSVLEKDGGTMKDFVKNLPLRD